MAVPAMAEGGCSGNGREWLWQGQQQQRWWKLAVSTEITVAINGVAGDIVISRSISGDSGDKGKNRNIIIYF